MFKHSTALHYPALPYKIPSNLRFQTKSQDTKYTLIQMKSSYWPLTPLRIFSLLV